MRKLLENSVVAVLVAAIFFVVFALFSGSSGLLHTAIGIGLTIGAAFLVVYTFVIFLTRKDERRR